MVALVSFAFGVIGLSMASSAPSLSAGSLTKTVRTDSYDLQDAVQVGRMMRAVSAAAYYVCRHEAFGRLSVSEREACHAEAMRRVRPRIDELLTKARAIRFKPGRLPLGPDGTPLSHQDQSVK